MKTIMEIFFRHLDIKKIYITNIYEALINNDFNFKSFDFISSKGYFDRL